MTPEAAVLFGLFIVLLLFEVPVALCLGASAAAVILLFRMADPVVVAQQLFSAMDSYPLLAIPLFLTAGHLLARGGMAPRLLAFVLAVAGRVRGGTAMVAIIVSLLFAGISGSGPADTAALGALLLPLLRESGMPAPRAASLIAAGGGIGIIVPPSIALIVYGVVSETPIGTLFLAGIVPGLLVGLSLGAAVLALNRETVPPASLPTVTASNAAGALCALAAPVIILGGIYSGLCTPTESAAIAVIYILAADLLLYRELWSWRAIAGSLAPAGRASAQILWIVACASLFSWVLHASRTTEEAGRLILSLTENRYVLLLAVNAFLLAAGCFIDAISIMYIFVPLFLPVMTAAGIDPVHFGVIVAMNLAIGQITPPVGVNLFVASAFSGVPAGRLGRAVVPFAAAETAALAAVSLWPALALAIPEWLGAA